jgi:large subunit ribosomal protein L21
MYAIIDNHGKQVRVSAGETIEVDHIDAEIGAEITFDRVLLVGADDVKVGQPLVEGASVKAKVVAHERGPKVIAFTFPHPARIPRFPHHARDPRDQRLSGGRHGS